MGDEPLSKFWGSKKWHVYVNVYIGISISIIINNALDLLVRPSKSLRAPRNTPRTLSSLADLWDRRVAGWILELSETHLVCGM